MKKILALVSILIFLLPVVFAGVTAPLPSNIELTKDESSRFKFQIQAVNSDDDIVCTYAFNQDPPFLVEFDDTETTVAAGSRANVYGTVTPTEATGYGTTKSEFCVSCGPVNAPAGASVKVDTCGLALTVTLVNERTRDNLNVPEKEKKGLPLSVTTLFVILGLAIVAFIVYLLLRKKREYFNQKKLTDEYVAKPVMPAKGKVKSKKKVVKKKPALKKTKRSK